MAAQGHDRALRARSGPRGSRGRAISYGTSSYGYDIRCADEFKIFTNINSAVVDPKGFDANSFVDVKSDVCIIPPNSFALARTVEYFRIPAQCPDHLPGQVNLRALRHHRQCDAAGTGVGRARHAGVFQYHTPACQRSTPTKASRRCCSLNPMKSARRPTGPGREVPGAAGRYLAEGVRKTNFG